MDIETELRRVSEALEEISSRIEGRELPLVLTKQRAAKELSRSLSIVKQLIRDGMILTVKIKGTVMIPASEVIRLSTPPTPSQHASRDQSIVEKTRVSVRASSEAQKIRQAVKKQRAR
jgi:hypothetical protein